MVKSLKKHITKRYNKNKKTSKKSFTNQRIGMFSLIILNFKRPNNTIKILDNMKHFKFIDEIIISNGNLENSVNYNDAKIKIYNDYNNLNDVYSLDRRFICGLRAKNENIIIIDDDIYIEEDELKKIVIKYNSDPNRIIGNFCRNINKEGYIMRNEYGNADIVLTKLLICQKKICNLFFICKPLIEHIYKKGKPYGNGEDIFLSFIASVYYKRKNFCLRNIQSKELSQNNAVSGDPEHLSYRNELSSYLINNYHIFDNLCL
jgi:hypothetical protein